MRIQGKKLLTQALRDVNLISIYDEADDEKLYLAIDEMNELLDQLATLKHFITGTESFDFDIEVGKYAYTLGPGGDWPLKEPPERIEIWSTVHNAGQQSEYETPRGAPLTDRQWQGISAKRQRQSFPLALYAPGKLDNHGLPTVYLAPVPTSLLWKVRLYLSQSAITTIAPENFYDLPRGYAKALRKMLAVELMQSQQRDIDPALVASAERGFKLIARQNRAKGLRSGQSPIDSSFVPRQYAFNIRLRRL